MSYLLVEWVGKERKGVKRWKISSILGTERKAMDGMGRGKEEGRQVGAAVAGRGSFVGIPIATSGEKNGISEGTGEQQV